MRCVCVHAAILLVVGSEMHHNGLILCGVANSSSAGLSCVVETRQCPGVGLASKLKAHPFIHFMQHEEDQARAQDHTIVLGSPG